ncbi:MAG: alpha/beta fold hydrolase, partial [Candidatus Limnocylindrus sp.]
MAHGRALAAPRMWRQVMGPLAASGWHVIAIDLPGFGLAEKGWSGAYDHASHARFV